MYRKDYIESEIQKLAQALAKILGFKKEGQDEEAHEQIRHVLSEGFGLADEQLDSISIEEFSAFLNEQNYPEEKLNILAQLIFESAHPFEDITEVNNRLHLVLVLFNKLEKDFHTQSLDNIAKRQMIDKFLNTDQYG